MLCAAHSFIIFLIALFLLLPTNAYQVALEEQSTTTAPAVVIGVFQRETGDPSDIIIHVVDISDPSGPQVIQVVEPSNSEKSGKFSIKLLNSGTYALQPVVGSEILTTSNTITIIPSDSVGDTSPVTTNPTSVSETVHIAISSIEVHSNESPTPRASSGLSSNDRTILTSTTISTFFTQISSSQILSTASPGSVTVSASLASPPVITIPPQFITGLPLTAYASASWGVPSIITATTMIIEHSSTANPSSRREKRITQIVGGIIGGIIGMIILGILICYFVRRRSGSDISHWLTAVAQTISKQMHRLKRNVNNGATRDTSNVGESINRQYRRWYRSGGSGVGSSIIPFARMDAQIRSATRTGTVVSKQMTPTYDRMTPMHVTLYAVPLNVDGHDSNNDDVAMASLTPSRAEQSRVRDIDTLPGEIPGYSSLTSSMVVNVNEDLGTKRTKSLNGSRTDSLPNSVNTPPPSYASHTPPPAHGIVYSEYIVSS
ncbi:hypothetical protein J3R30DRAFT_2159073 [Lentinula aciculospora]|uniref:Mid2 domain-containing protein n=1 Tax=Lentinula aciculospora TaxID=153920 RepID=A0A9W9AGY7_9AGAR|nr:hypothetical protein J3R30DRAFT_2159073 [Lentinula aciculospora]